MQKINFINYSEPSLSEDILNELQENTEEAISDSENKLNNNIAKAILNPVVESIECKNKFDMNGNILESIGYTSGTNTLESGKIKSTANIANGNGKGQIIQLKPNTVYTYSVKISSFEVSGSTSLRISPVNSEGNAVGYLVDQAVICEVDKVYSYSFTTSDTGKIWVMLNGISNSEDYSILKYVVYEYIQIEEGTTATSYTPFKRYGYDSKESMGSIVVDDISCKNLFNINSGLTETYNATPSVSDDVLKLTCTGGWAQIKYKSIPVEKGKTYILSLNVDNPSGNNVSFGVRKADDSAGIVTVSGITETKISKQTTFVTEENEVIIMLCANNTVDVNTNTVTFSNIQLEKGTVATNYSEYKKLDTDIYSFDTNLTYNSSSPQSFQNTILKNAKLVVCNFHSTDGNWDIQTQHLTSGTSFTSMQTSTNWYVASNFDSTLGKITFLTKSDNSNFVLNKITVVK